MGNRNVLVTGGTCTGKSTVCGELRRRGEVVVDGDRELAYQGDPASGAPVSVRPGDRPSHWTHIWDLEKARRLAASDADRVTFFCGDARNLGPLLPVFDAVVLLEVDRATLLHRLQNRPAEEFGGHPTERDLVMRLYDAPDRWPANVTRVDSTIGVETIVDALQRLA